MTHAGPWVGLGLAVALCATAPAGAHIVYGSKTLSQLVAEADRVVHARIVASGERVGLSTEEGAASRPTVEARVLEVLKGPAGERVRFAQHGHGVAPFAPGDETLLFLVDIERSRELQALESVVSWVSLQEHEDVYPVRGAPGRALLAATRAYVEAAGAPADERAAALRRATLALLTSGDADLAASALRDLVRAPGGGWLAEADLPALLPVLDDPGVSMGVRAALLNTLAVRGWVDADARWSKLLESAPTSRDRVTALRAAGAAAGPALRPTLVALLGDPEAEVAAAAAAALGTPGNADAVPALKAALGHADARVRMAAIRGLGRIQGPAADRVLEEAASSHADPRTRRRARVELDKRAAPPSS